MKKTVRILLGIICAFALSCSAVSAFALTDDRTVVPDLSAPETGLIAPAASILYAEQESDLAAQTDAAAPNVIIVRVDAEGNLLSEAGTVYATLETAPFHFDKYTYGFSINTLKGADLVAEFTKEKKLVDFMVVTDPNNTSYINSVRTKNNAARGVVDYSKKTYTTETHYANIVATASMVAAKIVILNQETATKAAILYMQSRITTTFVKMNSDATKEDFFSTVLAGANGVVSSNYPLLAEVLSSFTQELSATRDMLIVAHRGDNTVCPENTIEAAQEAYRNGARLIELDYHYTMDGVPVVIHDETINRVATNVDEMIAKYPSLKTSYGVYINAMTINQVKEVEIEKNGVIYRIPTLEEFFKEFSDREKYPDLVLVTEIKTNNVINHTAVNKIINETNMYDRMVYISFNSSMLPTVRKSTPQIPTGLLWHETTGMAGTTGTEQVMTVTDVINATKNYDATWHPFMSRADKESIEELALRGISVWAWTFGGAGDIARAYNMGLQSITTNYACDGKALTRSVSADSATVRTEWGTPVEIDLTRVTAGETQSIVSPTCFVSVSGPTATVQNGKVVFDTYGTAKFLLGYTDPIYGYTVYTDVLTAEVSKKTISYVAPECENYDGNKNYTWVYDGKEHKIAIDETQFPEGAVVTETDNGRVEPGRNSVTIVIDCEGYTQLKLSYRIIIEKMEATITAESVQTVTYDGTVKLPQATLNHEESELTYDVTDAVNPGTYTIVISAKSSTYYKAAESVVVTLIIEPVEEPSVEPTVEPSVEPTVEPSVETSVEPTVEPSVSESVEPSIEPSVSQTEETPEPSTSGQENSGSSCGTIAGGNNHNGGGTATLLLLAMACVALLFKKRKA
ncbi:MAG: hypothetical protein II368_00055 [Clostridia bacterium]|nr:hypothetical protein [Clostridia bacterium]